MMKSPRGRTALPPMMMLFCLVFGCPCMLVTYKTCTAKTKKPAMTSFSGHDRISGFVPWHGCELGRVRVSARFTVLAIPKVLPEHSSLDGSFPPSEGSRER